MTQNVPILQAQMRALSPQVDESGVYTKKIIPPPGLPYQLPRDKFKILIQTLAELVK